MKYESNIWGGLKQLKIPQSIVENGRLALKPDALAMLLILYSTAQGQQRTNTSDDVQAKIGYELLEKRSGRNKNTVGSGLKGLGKKFITWDSTRKKYAQFGTNAYSIINPMTGEPFDAKKGQDFVYHSGIRYFTIPEVLVKNHEERWSLAQMTASELRLYIALCWWANEKRSPEFKATLSELKKVTGFSTIGTVQNALVEMPKKGLVWADGDEYVLCNPFTGEGLNQEDDEFSSDSRADAANYRSKADDGRTTRAIFNTGDPHHLERILKACGIEYTPKSNNEYSIHCPFHADENPSCFVNGIKHQFHCFGCGEGGSWTQLVMKLRGKGPADAVEVIARCAGQGTGKTIEFVEPDKDKQIEESYKYKDSNGKLLKEVLRLPGKVFQQRRWGKGEWIYDIEGVKPTLYNLQWLRLASVVCMTEGEKDADTIKKLGMFATRGGEVLGVTSGNAKSWRDEFADDLVGKLVVIMPDNDDAGHGYRDQIAASLKSRGIDYRVVSFADAGAKDITDFIEQGSTKDDVVAKIGKDWVRAQEPSPLDQYSEDDEPVVTI